MGVSLIPRNFQNFIRSDHVVLIEIDESYTSLPVGVIYKKDFDLSNISSEFIQTILAHNFNLEQ